MEDRSNLPNLAIETLREDTSLKAAALVQMPLRQLAFLENRTYAIKLGLEDGHKAVILLSIDGICLLGNHPNLFETLSTNPSAVITGPPLSYRSTNFVLPVQIADIPMLLKVFAHGRHRFMPDNPDNPHFQFSASQMVNHLLVNRGHYLIFDIETYIFAPTCYLCSDSVLLMADLRPRFKPIEDASLRSQLRYVINHEILKFPAGYELLYHIDKLGRIHVAVIDVYSLV